MYTCQGVDIVVRLGPTIMSPAARAHHTSTPSRQVNHWLLMLAPSDVNSSSAARRVPGVEVVEGRPCLIYFPLRFGFRCYRITLPLRGKRREMVSWDQLRHCYTPRSASP